MPSWMVVPTLLIESKFEVRVNFFEETEKTSNNKSCLALIDKDFIIKYENLYLIRELKDADLDEHTLELKFFKDLILKITESTIKKVFKLK